MSTANSKLKIDYGFDSFGTSNVTGDFRVSGNVFITGSILSSIQTDGDFIPITNGLQLGNNTNRWTVLANTGNFTDTLTVAGLTTLQEPVTLSKTLSSGNTTITGFANVTESVNSALITVGSSFIANTTGAYHTGVVNAASFTTSATTVTGLLANTIALVPTGSSANTVLLGNTTNRFVLSANTGNFSGQLTVSGNTTLTGNATLSGTLQTISGNTTFDSGVLFVDSVTNRVGVNNTAPTVAFEVTGAANVSTSVNSALFTVGSNFAANASGVYHTGVVNAASHTTSGFVANTIAIVPTSSTILLGNNTNRFVLSANTGNFSGNVTIGTTGGVVANGQIGTAGQVLASNGSSVYWSTQVGPQGAVGAQGAQGTAGTNGAQGAVGAQGAAGAQGPQGRQGFDGVQGAVGAQGAQGRQGAQGFQGVVGAQGAQGTIGAQGAAGGFSTGSNAQVNSLGVGTAASGTTGEIRANNNITAFYSSDRRFKENIQSIENALSKVCSIGGKTFDWTDNYISSHGGEDGYFITKSDFGVIAQDVQSVFPVAVRVRGDDSLAVDYEKLASLAFAAIVELKNEIDDLRIQINEIRNGN
jgi:hypothetical protein